MTPNTSFLEDLAYLSALECSVEGSAELVAEANPKLMSEPPTSTRITFLIHASRIRDIRRICDGVSRAAIVHDRSIELHDSDLIEVASTASDRRHTMIVHNPSRHPLGTEADLELLQEVRFNRKSEISNNCKIPMASKIPIVGPENTN